MFSIEKITPHKIILAKKSDRKPVHSHWFSIYYKMFSNK